MKSSFRSLVGLFLSFLVVPAITLAAPSRADAQPILLTLLHTNDVHGRVYLPGKPQGTSKIATMVREIRKEMPHVLLLDAGDIIHGTPVTKQSEGESAIATMNAMQYDAAASGNHEFDRGQRVTRKAYELAKFPFLSANILDTKTGKPWATLKPYIIREIEGVRVAIMGLTTLDTVKIEWPRTLEGITFADDIAIAKELVPKLRDQEHADVVIAVTHLGVNEDKKLAGAVPGIDIILGGHSHTRLDQQVWEGRTLIMQTGSTAVTLGRADVVIDKSSDPIHPTITINGQDGKWWGHDGVPVPKPAAGHAYPSAPLIPVAADTPDDPEVLVAYRPFADKVQPLLDEVLTEALEPLPALQATRREVAIGQILADAVRAHAKTDLALIASSQISPRGLVKGPVHVADLYELIPAYTRQHIVVMRIPGALLRAMATQTFVEGKMPVHISGFKVAGDQITVGDQPLDDRRIYTIAAAAHVLQDYFLGKPGAEVVSDDVEAPHFRDAAIEFLRKHAPLTNAVEKRITR